MVCTQGEGVIDYMKLGLHNQITKKTIISPDYIQTVSTDIQVVSEKLRQFVQKQHTPTSFHLNASFKGALCTIMRHFMY